MKKFGIIGAAALAFTFASCSGEEETTIEETIEITDENGETEVEITTTEDGVTTEKKYTGEAAKKKVEEIEKEPLDGSKSMGETKTIIKKETRSEMESNKKTLTKAVEDGSTVKSSDSVVVKKRN